MKDDRNLVSMMYGPLVLAGITDKEVEFGGHPKNVDRWVKKISDDPLRFRAKSRSGEIEFMPMYEVVDEKFGIYFRTGR